MSLGSKDEAVSFVYFVESPLPKEDDARNVDIRILRASNASEPSLQAMARAPITQPNLGRRERSLSHR